MIIRPRLMVDGHCVSGLYVVRQGLGRAWLDIGNRARRFRRLYRKIYND